MALATIGGVAAIAALYLFAWALCRAAARGDAHAPHLWTED